MCMWLIVAYFTHCLLASFLRLVERKHPKYFTLFTCVCRKLPLDNSSFAHLNITFQKTYWFIVWMSIINWRQFIVIFTCLLWDDNNNNLILIFLLFNIFSIDCHQLHYCVWANHSHTVMKLQASTIHRQQSGWQHLNHIINISLVIKATFCLTLYYYLYYVSIFVLTVCESNKCFQCVCWYFHLHISRLCNNLGD